MIHIQFIHQKALLQQTVDFVEHAPPETIPPALVDAQKAAVARVQANLLESSSEVDWGVVAVYTCTNSCGGDDNDRELGAYRQEFAWKQPSLDQP